MIRGKGSKGGKGQKRNINQKSYNPFLSSNRFHPQIGQIPILDRLLLKNPIYLKLSEWGFIDATFPVARFARARMSERLPELDGADGQEKNSASSASMSAAQKQKQQPDLLSKFIAARESRPDFMTDTLVQTMAVSMAFAGSETTAISLASVFYNLLRHPEALAKLRREIDDAGQAGVFGDQETGLVTWAESQRLPYLDACVKEAFRVHPAAGLPLERVVPEGGAEIAGHWVEAGTVVGCSAWVLHRRPEVFGADANVYRPDRWIPREGDPDDEKRIKEMNGMMFQFGMGSRTCIGKNISLLEIYKLVPSLLRRFEVRFPPSLLHFSYPSVPCSLRSNDARVLALRH